MSEKPDSIFTDVKKKPRGKSFEKGNPYRFPPGVSGNPGGRPKGLMAAVNKWLEEEDDTGKTNAEKVAAKIGEEVLAGNVAAFNAFCRLTEGDGAGIGVSFRTVVIDGFD